MIILNEKKLDNLCHEDFYILTDFDGIITKQNSDSSWASIFKNPKVSKEFIDECIKLYEYYHKYEIDESISIQEKLIIMKEWYIKNIETLKKYCITKEIINYSANNEKIMAFRDGAKEFLENMYSKNVPIIVISAGVGNIIEQFLIKNNCNYPNIHICSNFLEYENGIVNRVRDNNLIHPLNKNEVSLPESIKEKIIKRNNIILLGNSISDINMADDNKDVYKIGFLDEKIEDRIELFKQNYDMVCTNNTSFYDIVNKIEILN